MTKQGIDTGGFSGIGADTLYEGALKINSNFDEIYSAIGDGNSLSLEVNSASPIQISLSGSTLTFNVVGIGSTTLNLA